MKTISTFFAKRFYHGWHGFHDLKWQAASSLLTLLLFVTGVIPSFAQIQQAWVVKYNNNGITNGNHQALKMALDSAGNIYVLGVSANVNTNTGYVVAKYAPSGAQTWAVRYDSTNYPAASPTGFALDSSNNVVVTGNAITLKYDSTGNLLWTEPYNGTAIAVDPGQNVYITGVSDNFTTVKLNPTGSNVWSETYVYRGLQNLSQAIAVDSSSNVYVAGLESWSISKSTYQPMGVVKYDLNGNQLWVNSVDEGLPVDGPNVVGLVIAGDGSVYTEFNFSSGIGNVSGYQTSKINADGSVAWNDNDPTGYGASLATSLAVDSNGNSLITGGNAQFYPDDCYGTYKIDTNGNYIWTNLFPNIDSGNSIATSIAVDQANNVYITGSSPAVGTNRNNDIVTIKYDRTGPQVWLQRYNEQGQGNAAGSAIAVDNSGNVYVAGYETETNGFTSMILIKYSPATTIQKQSNGNVILQAYGSPGENFDFQASTNLQIWQNLGTIAADTNGLAQFDDTNAPLFPARFYYTIPK